MVATQTTQFVVTPRRVTHTKYVSFAYVGPNRYVVEFHSNGRIRYYRRSGVNYWFKYLNKITCLCFGSGGLYVLKG